VDPIIKLELTAVCEEVGYHIDDHAIRNEPHDLLISASMTWGAGGLGAQSTASFQLSAARPDDDPAHGLSTGRGESHGKQD
jgi:hypothetical protein